MWQIQFLPFGTFEFFFFFLMFFHPQLVEFLDAKQKTDCLLKYQPDIEPLCLSSKASGLIGDCGIKKMDFGCAKIVKSF